MLTSATMTRADIKKRVALRARKIVQDADSGKIIADTTEPANTQLDDAVRDGVEDFWNFRQWAFASQIVQFDLNADGAGPLNIDSDPSRYLLPDLVRSVPIGGKVLVRGPGDSCGWSIPVRHMDQVIARQFLEAGTSGMIQMCAVEFISAVRPGLSERGGFECRFWPAPGDTYTVAMRMMVGAVPLVNDSQRGNWPGAHDKAIVACSVRALFRHDQPADSAARRTAEAEAVQALAESTQYDDENCRPQVLGSIEESFSGGRHVEMVDLTTGLTVLSTTVFS